MKRKSDGGSHHIVDVDGAAFYVLAGWLELKMAGKTGEIGVPFVRVRKIWRAQRKIPLFYR